MTAIRGAITVTDNDVSSISRESLRLYTAIVERNGLDRSALVCLVISITDDIDALNPATALRKAGVVGNLPLFCVQEAKTKGSLGRCIRYLLLTNQAIGQPRHVYLEKAADLRPDLRSEE